MIIDFLYNNDKALLSANAAYLFAHTSQQHPKFSVRFCYQPDLSAALPALLRI